jgi:hypothetical protein
MMRQFRSPSRWTWVLPAIATVFIASCDTSLEGINLQGTWGFITVNATKNASGAHLANTEGLFFTGNLNAVPNADFVRDTCADAVFTGESNNLVDVTYLDAGVSLTATVGGVDRTLERTTSAGGLVYKPATPFSYTPGDSIFVEVPGVPGGFPGGAVRAKTAEAFTFPTAIDDPAGTEAIQLEWTPPQDPRSAMVVSLRYATNTNPAVLSRHVQCTFIDDGVDSIPFRWHQTWTTSQGARAVVATRLRTNYVGTGDANLGVISTYQVPTPPNP